MTHFGDVVNILNRKLAKSHNFRSLRHKKIKTIQYFIFFSEFDVAKGGASVPLSPPLVAPLISGTQV